MNELDDKDWELLNAYHDGELCDAERRAFERRLRTETALSSALKQVASVSGSLSELRPTTHPAPFLRDATANRTRQAANWLLGGAVAAVITLAVAVGPRFFEEPSVFDIHSRFVAQSFSVDLNDVRKAAAGGVQNAPDLASARLVPVSTRNQSGRNAIHYAGQDGCRLTYVRGMLGPEGRESDHGNQVAIWTSADGLDHMIIATGMDQEKFNGIAEYLKLLTRHQSSERMMASLVETVERAKRCVG